MGDPEISVEIWKDKPDQLLKTVKMRNINETGEPIGLSDSPIVELDPQDHESEGTKANHDVGVNISSRSSELAESCEKEKTTTSNRVWGAGWLSVLGEPKTSSAPPVELPKVKSSTDEKFIDNDRYQNHLTDSFCKGDVSAVSAPKSLSSNAKTGSSLHALAIACEITDTDSSMRRCNEFETIGSSGQSQKLKAVNIQAPLPISQDASRPYSNLANEWVINSKQLGENTSAVDIRSNSTSPISINDVLCGRGGMTNHHAGNIFFRKLVRHHQESYLLATKKDKAGVAKGIVEAIRGLKPPGRFLKKTRDIGPNGVWVEIGDRKAREKTSQALRERAPELREELGCQGKQQQQHHKVDDFIQHSFQQREQQQNVTDKSGLTPYVRQVTCDSLYPSPDNASPVHTNKNRNCHTRSAPYHLIRDPTNERLTKRPKIIPPNPSIPPATSFPCGFQTQSGIGLISSSEEDSCETQEPRERKISQGGPRIKMIKDRVQKVV